MKLRLLALIVAFAAAIGLWRPGVVRGQTSDCAAYEVCGACTTLAVENAPVVVCPPGQIVARTRFPRRLRDDFCVSYAPEMWGEISGGTVAAHCGTAGGATCSNDRALWFGGVERRFATTRYLNTSVGCAVRFWLRTGSDPAPPCERPDLPSPNPLSGEDVFLQYQPQGTTAWTVMAHLSAADYAEWTQVCVPIPAAAQTPATRFRWFQPERSIVGGQPSDNWALDAVSIDAALPASSVYDYLDGDAVWHAPDGAVVHAGDTLAVADAATAFFTLSSASCPAISVTSDMQYGTLSLNGLAWQGANIGACPGDPPPPLGVDASSSVPPGAAYAWFLNNVPLPFPPQTPAVQLPPMDASSVVRLVVSHPTCGGAEVTLAVPRPEPPQVYAIGDEPFRRAKRCLSSNDTFVLSPLAAASDTMCPVVGWQVKNGDDGAWTTYDNAGPALAIPSFSALAVEINGSTTFEQKLKLSFRTVHECACAAGGTYVYHARPFELVLVYEPVPDSADFYIEEDTLCMSSAFPNPYLAYHPETEVEEPFNHGLGFALWRIQLPDGGVFETPNIPEEETFNQQGLYRITAVISGPEGCVVFEKQDSIYLKDCSGALTDGFVVVGSYHINGTPWICQGDCDPRYQIIFNAMPYARFVRLERYEDGWESFSLFPFGNLEDLTVTDGTGAVIDPPEPNTSYPVSLPMTVEFWLDECFDEAAGFGLRPVIRYIVSNGVFYYIRLPPIYTDVISKSRLEPIDAYPDTVCAGEPLPVGFEVAVGEIYYWQQWTGTEWATFPGSYGLHETVLTIYRNTQFRIVHGDTGGLCMDTLDFERFVFDVPVPELSDVERCTGQLLSLDLEVEGYGVAWEYSPFPQGVAPQPLPPDFTSDVPGVVYVRPVLLGGLCSPITGGWFRVFYDWPPETGTVRAQADSFCYGDVIVFEHVNFDPDPELERTWSVRLGSSEPTPVENAGPTYTLVAPNDVQTVTAVAILTHPRTCEVQSPPLTVHITSKPQIPPILAFPSLVCAERTTHFFPGETNGQVSAWRWCAGEICAGLAFDDYPNVFSCPAPDCPLSLSDLPVGPVYVYAQIEVGGACPGVLSQRGEFWALGADVTAEGATTCPGDSTPLSVVGAVAVVWFPADGLNDPFSTTPMAAPAQTVVYTVQATAETGCVVETTVEVVVLPAPQPTVWPAATALCGPNDAVVLYASGADGYLWLPFGATDDSLVVTAADTATVIELVGTGGQCTTTTIVPAPVYYPEVVLFTEGATACFGQPATLRVLNPEADVQYVWEPGGYSGPEITVNAAAALTYTLNATRGPCPPVMATADLTVLGDSVWIAGTNVVCAGQSTTLAVQNAQSAVWWPPTGLDNPNATTTSAAPAQTTVYTVMATTAEGCTFALTAEVVVHPLPELAASASAMTICGASGRVVWHASGAENYLWLPSGSTADSLVVTPSGAGAHFTLTGTNGGLCQATLALPPVSYQPDITVVTQSANVCPGQATVLRVLNPASDITYVWEPGGHVGATLSVSGDAAATYTVTAQHPVCPWVSATARLDVLPAAQAAISFEPFCFNDSLRLGITATGANVFPLSALVREQSTNRFFSGTLNQAGDTVFFDWEPFYAGEMTFTVETRTPQGCVAVQTFQRTFQPSSQEPKIVGLPQELCLGQRLGGFTLAPPGGELRLNGKPVAPDSLPQLGKGANVFEYLIFDGACERGTLEHVRVVSPPQFEYGGYGYDFCAEGPKTLSVAQPETARYQWYKDGSRIPNAKADSYLAEAPGEYTVVASSVCGTDTARFSVFSSMPAVVITGPGAYCGGPPASLKAHGVGGDFDEVNWIDENGRVHWGSEIAISPGFSAVYALNARLGHCRETVMFPVARAEPKKIHIHSPCDTLLKGEKTTLSTDVACEWRDENDEIVHVGTSWEVSPERTTFFRVIALNDSAPYCTLGVKRVVVVEPFDLPNVFTPNDDGVNDRFEWPIVFAKRTSVHIFDRWGALMFSTDEPYRFWTGRFNGRPAPEGVYFYVYEYELCGESRRLRGSFTLLR